MSSLFPGATLCSMCDMMIFDFLVTFTVSLERRHFVHVGCLCVCVSGGGWVRVQASKQVFFQVLRVLIENEKRCSSPLACFLPSSLPCKEQLPHTQFTLSLAHTHTRTHTHTHTHARTHTHPPVILPPRSCCCSFFLSVVVVA